MRQLIRNAQIVIGDGQTSAFGGDVLLEDGRIAALGSVPVSLVRTADKVVEAGGRMLAPSFVDTHNHGALGGTLPLSQPLLEPGEEERTLPCTGLPMACELALRAGVTKRICGVDGYSPAPVRAEDREDYASQLRALDGSINEPWPWTSVPQFYDWLLGRSVTDLGLYLGHSAVRRAVMGNAPRLAHAQELEAMEDLVRQEAPHVLGLSTGLVYQPAVYGDKAELEALLRAFAQVAPAALFPHLRSESDMILPSLDECLQACVRSNAAYCNEHSKIAGARNYAKIGQVEDKLKDGTASVPLMANMYPYTAGSTTGDALFPPEFRAGSRDAFRIALRQQETRRAMVQKIRGDTTGWDNFIYFCGGLDGIQIAGAAHDRRFLGKRLADVVRERGIQDIASEEAFAVVFDYFLENDLEVTIISHYGSELTMERFFRREDMAICTDGLMPGPGRKPHPRSLGAFPKSLRLAREMGLAPERIIWRMSTLPCRFLGLDDPVLRVGSDASLVLLNWAQARECNDYERPLVVPKGIDHVWVHGHHVLNEGVLSCAKPYPGRILLRRTPPRGFMR